MKHSSYIHPIHNVYGGQFKTISGITVDLHNPTPEMIVLEDIAAALSKICRFGGHTRKLYSVAQHSCLVASLVPAPLMAEGLLHDGAEGYLGDVIKPLKLLIAKDYEAIYARFDKVIAEKFRLFTTDDVKHIIEQCDRLAVELESEAFQRGNMRPLAQAIRKNRLSDDFSRCWSPEEAESRFWLNYDIIKRVK